MKHFLIWILALVAWIGIAWVYGGDTPKHTVKTSLNITNSFWIKWSNDGVYYQTNTVTDKERNRTNANRVFMWVKEEVSTNKVTPFYFRKDDKKVELGFRSDGVVVWREVP